MSTLVSVIIPVKELSYRLLFECLPAFAQQTYTSYEVIVLPNEHSLYDLTLLKKYPFLKIIPTGKITKPAEKRDKGAEKAQGNLLAFIDDDAYPDKNWIRNALNIYVSLKKQKPALGALCGPGLLPSDSSFWEKVFNQILSAELGSGSFGYRFEKRSRRFVDDYPSMNFFIEKKLFNDIGGFNNQYWPGEDSKLCNDIVYKKSRLILYDPNIAVYHHRRENLGKFLYQHGQYGFHRGAFFAHGDNNSLRLAYLFPALFVIYLIIAAILLPLTSLLPVIPISALTFFLLPFYLYAIMLSYLFIVAAFTTHSVFISIMTPVTLFMTHIFYGIMFIRGFFTGYLRKKNIY
ncbi:glycosyltransferase [Candidatus Roizmanbacteria bacterium]|nr:glycosyltransferase [Candidatus Roizmanbacteria bacterium]